MDTGWSVWPNPPDGLCGQGLYSHMAEEMSTVQIPGVPVFFGGMEAGRRTEPEITKFQRRVSGFPAGRYAQIRGLVADVYAPVTYQHFLKSPRSYPSNLEIERSPEACRKRRGRDISQRRRGPTSALPFASPVPQSVYGPQAATCFVAAGAWTSCATSHTKEASSRARATMILFSCRPRTFNRT